MSVSLMSSLNLGDRTLRAINVALAVTGQNVANATTEGYHRQRVEMTPGQPTDMVSYQIGTGVEVRRIERVIDFALEQLILEARASAGNLETLRSAYLRLESVFNEFSDADLSAALNNFFSAVEDLSQRPEDAGARAALVSAGAQLADTFRSLANRITQARASVDAGVQTTADDINRYLKEIADLNRQIVITEDGGLAESKANTLRDRRGALLERLSELIEVTAQEQSTGAIIVYAGSDVLVYGDNAETLERTTTFEGGINITEVRVASTGKSVAAFGGKLAGMFEARDQVLGDYLDQINTLARELIGQFNFVHTQGRGTANYESLTSGNAVVDSAALLSDAGLDFEVRNGSFNIFAIAADGTETVHNIKLDLEGAGDGIDDVETLNDLARAIKDSFENPPASGNYDIEVSVVGGRLEMRSMVPGLKFAFGEDTSGVLAALGINTFFSGKDAFSIDINPVVEANPGFVAAARSSAPGDNSNTQILADLRNQAFMRDGTSTFESYYEELIGALAAESATVQDQYVNQRILTDQAMNERDAISGVSIDEETINLMTYQRMFQATARYISIVNDLLNTLISMA